MIIGGFAPLAQTSLKRLLAYSSIGHMGLLLMPLCVQSDAAGMLSGWASSNVGALRMGADATNLRHNGVGAAATGDIGALWTHMFIYI